MTIDQDSVLNDVLKRVEATKRYTQALKDFDHNPTEATHNALKGALLQKYSCDNAILGNYELQAWVKAMESTMIKNSKQMRVHWNDTHSMYIQRGRREGERAYLTVRLRYGASSND